MAKAGEGTSRQATGARNKASPLPLDEGWLSPGTKTGVLTGAKNRMQQLRAEGCPDLHSSVDLTIFWWNNLKPCLRAHHSELPK